MDTKNSRQARAGVAAIDVEFELLEPLLDADEAVARGSLLGEPRIRQRGDVERGFAEADVVCSGEFRTSVVLHNSLETHQAVVQWVGDSVEVHISTQFIWGVRDELAEGLGLPPDKVRVAANLCRIIERELRLGPPAGDRERAALARLLGRDGTLAELNEALSIHLRTADARTRRPAA